MPELRTLPELISLPPTSAMAVRQGEVTLTYAQLSGLAAGPERVIAGIWGEVLGRLRKRIPTQSQGSSLPVHEGSAG